MTTKTLTSLEEAATQLLDTLMNGKNVTLDLAFEDGAARAMEPLMAATDAEARRRGVGIVTEFKERNRLCLSLRRP